MRGIRAYSAGMEGAGESVNEAGMLAPFASLSLTHRSNLFALCLACMAWGTYRLEVREVVGASVHERDDVVHRRGLTQAPVLANLSLTLVSREGTLTVRAPRASSRPALLGLPRLAHSAPSIIARSGSYVFEDGEWRLLPPPKPSPALVSTGVWGVPTFSPSTTISESRMPSLAMGTKASWMSSAWPVVRRRATSHALVRQG